MEKFPQDVVQKGCAHKRESIPPSLLQIVPDLRFLEPGEVRALQHLRQYAEEGFPSPWPSRAHWRDSKVELGLSHLQKDRRNTERSF